MERKGVLVRLPAPLVEKMGAKAAEMGVSRNRLMTDALQGYLDGAIHRDVHREVDNDDPDPAPGAGPAGARSGGGPEPGPADGGGRPVRRIRTSIVPGDIVIAPAPHPHRRVKGEVAFYAQGQPLHVYTCSVPGCDWSVTE